VLQLVLSLTPRGLCSRQPSWTAVPSIFPSRFANFWIAARRDIPLSPNVPDTIYGKKIFALVAISSKISFLAAGARSYTVHETLLGQPNNIGPLSFTFFPAYIFSLRHVFFEIIVISESISVQKAPKMSNSIFKFTLCIATTLSTNNCTTKCYRTNIYHHNLSR
jgi:hypothetical protein